MAHAHLDALRRLMQSKKLEHQGLLRSREAEHSKVSVSPRLGPVLIYVSRGNVCRPMSGKPVKIGERGFAARFLSQHQRAAKQDDRNQVSENLLGRLHIPSVP